MLVNAEGLPIEGIDKIEITLNPELFFFINREKIFIDAKKHLSLRFAYKYGAWYFLDIQAQIIKQNNYDIRSTIAYSIYKLMETGFIDFPCEVSYIFVYNYLDFFVNEIREIEFYFDFKPEMIQIANPAVLFSCKETLYSNDRRKYENRPARKSFISIYDRTDHLLKVNQLPHNIIKTNKYSRRIEFRLTKYNCPYRTINNLTGTQHDVIMRHIPYMAILYRRFLANNVIVSPNEHPYFTNIYALAQDGRTRYCTAHAELALFNAS
jgi:hypothetical protein